MGNINWRKDKIKADETFYEYSSAVSSGTRNLSLSGLAAIWALRSSSISEISQLESSALIAGTMMILALSADFLQYVTATFLWWGYIHLVEHQKIALTSQHPKYINVLPSIFFISKIFLLCRGYYDLAVWISFKIK